MTADTQYMYFTNQYAVWKMPESGHGFIRDAEDNEWQDSICDIADFKGNADFREITPEEGEP